MAKSQPWPEDPQTEIVRLRESLDQANRVIGDQAAQIERLQRQLTDPRRKPLCESKGCPRSAIGYVESNGVRWLACDQHGGRAEAAQLREALIPFAFIGRKSMERLGLADEYDHARDLLGLNGFEEI